MQRVVAKFGGTSVADARQFAKVKAIVDEDPARELVVVSAPGRSDLPGSGGGHKITDMLAMCHQLASHRLHYDEVFTIVATRYRHIHAELGLGVDLAAALDGARALLETGAPAPAVIACGERLAALLMADHLGYIFVDAADTIRMTTAGALDAAATRALLAARFPPGTRAVIPGFYGADADGTIHLFARGGSDITGAIVADALHASRYENWTDVSGFLMADPTVVDHPRPIEALTYTELRELSYMGAQVLHEESIFPVREAGIPIHIRNTHTPTAPGTRIVPELTGTKPSIITGIAGRRDFAVVTVEKLRMRTFPDFWRKLLSVFESNEVTVEHMPTGIDSVSLIVPESQFRAKQAKICEEIRIYCEPDALTIPPPIALLAVVGQGMDHTKGVAARIFAALHAAGVNVRMISQGASELNVLVGVDNHAFADAMRAVYAAFVKEEA